MNEFYGPLYIWSQTGKMAIAALLQRLGREKHSFTDATLPPMNEELQEWRLWVQSVFMPLNLYLEQLILEKAYLIREQEMPKCLLDFVTHVSSYKPLLEKWASGDFTSHVSLILFPTELDSYAADSYADLKAEQLRLIGTIQKSKNK